MTALPYLRLGGCVDHGQDGDGWPLGIEGLQSVARSEFFTVYLMDRHGIAHALLDRDTLLEGVWAMLALSWRSGLAATLCPFLSATE